MMVRGAAAGLVMLLGLLGVLWLRKRAFTPLALFLVLLSPAPAGAITLSTIRSDCRVYVKDTGATRQRYSDAILLRFINEGQKDVNQQLWPIQKSYSFPLVSGTTYYSTPADFLHVLRLTRDFDVLDEKSPKALDKNGEWEIVGGLPQSYFVNFSSRSKIGFYPFPESSASTGTVRMDYVAQVADLAADSDTPYNSILELQPYGHLLSFYCAYRAALIDGQMDMGQAYFAEYQRGLARMSEDATARPAYKPGVVGRSAGGP